MGSTSGWVVREAQNGASSPGSHVYTIAVNATDDVVSVSDGDCLTDGTTCTELTVTFDRTENTDPSRGVSADIQLSPELELCDPSDLASNFTKATGSGAWEGTYDASMQLLDNGGGSYTVDLAILGTSCGPTTGVDLFTVSVKRAAGVSGNAVGTVAVTDVLVRDYLNAPLPGLPGVTGEVPIDQTAPAAVTDLVATQVKSGNDSDGTTKIQLSWTAPGGDADYVEIWRNSYGDYPEYDDGTGAEPILPLSNAGWSSIGTVSAGDPRSFVDEPATRDFYYYAAVVYDGCGNASAVSGPTGGTLNYHLGDVTDGVVNGNGNNAVGSGDLSHLGFNYGATLPLGASLNYLDVGPTSDFSVDGLPTTDDVVQFEDLMVFAMNFQAVSKRFDAPAPATSNDIALHVGQVDSDETLEVAVRMTGNGRIQGLSIPLTWNDSAVEPLSVRPGELMARQGGQGMVLSPEPGVVDAALIGVRDQGLSGEGALAHVTFRVKGAGEPRIGLGEIIARDSENGQVLVAGSVGGTTPSAVPSVSGLAEIAPNPFNPATEVKFSLARAGRSRCRSTICVVASCERWWTRRARPASTRSRGTAPTVQTARSRPEATSCV